MQKLVLVRHGQTSWALEGKHTGLTDIPLTEKGILQAKSLIPLLAPFSFEKIFVSPLQRAKNTFLLSGIHQEYEIDADLCEWDYGDYEGLTTPQIQQQSSDWNIFKKGAPNGESVDQIQIRADRILKKATSYSGDVAFFASGHILRAISARFLNQPVSFGKHISLSTGSLSILGYERVSPVILLWNLTQEGT